jgi:hypothetical protein
VHRYGGSGGFDLRAVMENRFIDFTKAMEGIDTIPGPMADRDAALAR